MKLAIYDNNVQPITFASGIEMVKHNEIRKYKEHFIKNSQDLEKSGFIESEVIASWHRSKNYHIDPQMRENHFVLRPQELRALLNDKKTFIDLVKFYSNALRPLLNIPRMALIIQDQDGTVLNFSDHDQLLQLNITAGSIGSEECAGTTSTSLCIELGKIVQLAGPLHYCRALEHHFGTTTPVCDIRGTPLGLITIIAHIKDVLYDEETLNRISLWASTLSFTVENQIELSKRTSMLFEDPQFTMCNREGPHAQQEHKNEAEHSFSRILGESQQIKSIIQTASRFAPTENGILITGESGTGKEIFAKAIHDASGRSGPFVAINCAALPSNLIASELFGYVGGAFTGAESKGRQGKIELAMNGTLFLDEIGDMPLEIQPTFLRVLEDKKVMRLGSNKDVQVDFRLIVATNCDLYQLVKEKKFREDLYYRLGVLELALPPLRERGKDILLLANHFLKEFCLETGHRPLKLSKQVESFMLNYDWPGNVRQLKNAILYAANMCEEQVIKPEDLPNNVYRSRSMPQSNIASQGGQPLSSLQDMEKEMLTKTLILTGYNVSSTASILGLSKASVYRKMKDYNIAH